MMLDLAHIRRMADLIATTNDRDEELGFLDTLAGETSLEEIADHLIDEALAADALADAVKVQQDALAHRRKRIEDRSRALRRALLETLDAAGIKKLERPRATISRRAGVMGVEIEDEASVPSQLMTVKTTTSPDKKAIKAQIEAGVDVPGCTLVRGADSISLRVA
ncbi:siphovirus Gp157 family protein [Paracoccus yeei]|uniref:siphovirus Gp157 family protein n=1 Tax=Paracoccus yeei TaxID=147645 RepID=UPI0028D8B429|nr:siphovirus Gp157 family protein [Paracoccus yeei]